MKKKPKAVLEISSKKDYYDKLKMPKDFLEDETMSLEWQQKEQKKANQTSSQKKMFSYLKDLTESSAFRSDLREFRKKFKITPNQEGFKEPEGYRESLIAFARKYKLTVLWEDALECYILYEKFPEESMGSMIDVEDVQNYFHGGFQFLEEGEFMKGYIEEKSKEFPVAIFLNPYVSQRDVLDYVKNMFRLSIEPKLKWYREEGVKLGKVRRKNSRVEMRDEFIFNHRDKPPKEIARLVAEAFKEFLEYTYISRIIKEQIRIRK